MPSKPNSTMRKFLDAVTKEAFGKTFTEAKRMKECVTCDASNLSFTDDLSIKEYGISGMCQSCQNKVFGGEDNG